MENELAIGIDIGGTSTRVALIENGLIFDSRSEPTPPSGDPDRLSELLAKHVADVRSSYDGLDPSARFPTGVALPGIRDPLSGIMRRCLNLPRLEGLDMTQFFRHALGQAVLIETDVNAAAFAQWEALAPRPARFLYLSIGTGIGGAVLLDGQLLRHTNNSAGHFGFLVVDTSATAHSGRTGVPGCLEALAAGPVIARADSVGRKAAAQAVAIGLQQLTSVYQPDMIALGGGAIDNFRDWFIQIEDAFADRPTAALRDAPQLIRAPLRSDDAGVIGVAALARRTD